MRNSSNRPIVITGAAGRLGRLVTAAFLERGFEVVGVDRVAPPDRPCRFLTADLTEAAAVYDVLQGARAAVHLAAIPGPLACPASTTFVNNVLSTFHVVQAAAALGLEKLVFASSIFTLGWTEQAENSWPQYVPTDEQHPLTPLEAYGLSKEVGEAVCAQASRRWGLPVVSLRIMNVIQPGGYAAFPWEAPTAKRGVQFGLWPYVDARDAARACLLAVEADVVGHQPLFIAARDTRFDAPTAELLGELAPQVEIRRPLQGNETVIDITLAARSIGYEPEYSWRSECPAQNAPPGSS